MTNHIFVKFLLVFFVLSACSTSSSDATVKSEEQIAAEKLENNIKSYKEGEAVYSENCKTCHAGPEYHIDGPTLFDNLFERLPDPSQPYFLQFVKDSRQLEAKGDGYLNDIKKAYSPVSIDHTYGNNLSDSDIYKIMVYLMVVNKKKKGI